MDFRKPTLKALYHLQWLATVTEEVHSGSLESPWSGLLSLERAPPPRVITEARAAGALLLTGPLIQGRGMGGRKCCEEGPVLGTPATSGLTEPLVFNFRAFSNLFLFQFIF